jgi:hypothetical protein
VLLIFGGGAGLALNCNPPISTSQVAGIIGTIFGSEA